MSVGQARFEAPDGTVFERQVVHHPGAVVVVPLTSKDQVVLVRQFRAAVAEDLLELPAGKRDVPGEPPEVTAERELVEEVGLMPGRLDLLARFYNSPGFSDELSYVFLARELAPAPASPAGIEEKHMTVHEVELSSVPDMIRDGRIMDAKTIIGLGLTRELLAGSGYSPPRP